MKSSTHENVQSVNSNNIGPGSVCKLIHQTMLDLKTNKNRALLRKNTNMAPCIGNETRWASANNMMNKWEKIEEACDLASTEQGAVITMPPSDGWFKRAAKSTQGMLNDINHVSVLLQERLLPLYKCREYQEALMLTAEEGRRGPTTNHWYKNKFGTLYIASDSNKRPDITFANAVCKMQMRQAHTLTPREKAALDKWLEKPAGGKRKEARTTDAPISLADRLSKLVGTGTDAGKTQNAKGVCMNDSCFDHVIGSAAEVERLWSIARYVLTANRSSLAPILLEALLFLRMNRDLWNAKTVMEARQAVKSEAKDERLMKKLAELNEDVDGEAVDIEEDEDE